MFFREREQMMFLRTWERPGSRGQGKVLVARVVGGRAVQMGMSGEGAESSVLNLPFLLRVIGCDSVFRKEGGGGVTCIFSAHN